MNKLLPMALLLSFAPAICFADDPSVTTIPGGTGTPDFQNAKPMPLPQQIDQRKPSHMSTFVKLSETADRIVKQDHLSVTIQIEQRGIDPQSIQETVNRRLTAALTKAKNAQGVTVESGGYSVSEEYQSNANQNETVKGKRWIAVSRLILSSKDFDAVLKLSGELQKDGATIGNMRYELTEAATKALTDELTQEALTTLQSRAKKIADTMQMNLAGFVRIVVQNANDNRGYYARTAPMVASGPGNAAAPVGEAGYSTVQVTIEGEAMLENAGN